MSVEKQMCLEIHNKDESYLKKKSHFNTSLNNCITQIFLWVLGGPRANSLPLCGMFLTLPSLFSGIGIVIAESHRCHCWTSLLSLFHCVWMLFGVWVLLFAVCWFVLGLWAYYPKFLMCLDSENCFLHLKFTFCIPWEF